MKSIAKLIILCITAQYMISCSDEPNDSVGYKIELSRSDEQIAALSGEFGLKAMSAIAENETGNILFSPLSASTMLSMVAEGANGETRQEIIKTLGFDGIDIQAVNEYSRKVLSALGRLDKKTNISLANSFWHIGLPTKDSFEYTLGQYYDGSVYKTSEMVKDVNDWVAKKTEGRITRILTTDDDLCTFAFVNAMYFDGQWQSPFDKSLTKPMTFNNADGSTVSVPFMQRTSMMAYAEYGDKRMVTLPFGNGAFEANFILGTDKAAKSLSADEWGGLRKTRSESMVSMCMPKFELDASTDLIDVLMGMGIISAFTDKADFSNISDAKMQLSIVRQANKCKFDESGAIIASSSVGAGEFTTPGVKAEMALDRPFTFVISESSTGILLLIGSVNILGQD